MTKTSNGGHLKESKGFTLIELLVVIAIIGLLASVVLASIGSARQKGGDAAVKSNLDGIRSSAELVASDNLNSYANVCVVASAPNVDKAINAAKSAAGIATATNIVYGTAQLASIATCHSYAAGWAVSVPLLSSNIEYWCVDSIGNAMQTATLLGASDTTCN
mgnify:CR=1 FL=1